MRAAAYTVCTAKATNTTAPPIRAETPGYSLRNAHTHIGPAIVDQAIRDGLRAGLLDKDTATALTYIAKQSL